MTGIKLGSKNGNFGNATDGGTSMHIHAQGHSLPWSPTPSPHRLAPPAPGNSEQSNGREGTILCASAKET